MFKEFRNQDEMLKYESERQKYYVDCIGLCNRAHIFSFYKMLFLEFFHPKYRAIKKEYDGYCGGWWRNEKGWAIAECIHYIDPKTLCENTICLEQRGDKIFECYVYSNGAFHKIEKDLEHLFKLYNGGKVK